MPAEVHQCQCQAHHNATPNGMLITSKLVPGALVALDRYLDEGKFDATTLHIRSNFSDRNALLCDGTGQLRLCCMQFFSMSLQVRKKDKAAPDFKTPERSTPSLSSPANYVMALPFEPVGDDITCPLTFLSKRLVRGPMEIARSQSFQQCSCHN